MTPIHVSGEMAVWNEDKWAALEGDLQRQMRAERRRLDHLALSRRRTAAKFKQTAGWALVTAALLVVLFY